MKNHLLILFHKIGTICWALCAIEIIFKFCSNDFSFETNPLAYKIRI